MLIAIEHIVGCMNKYDRSSQRNVHVFDDEKHAHTTMFNFLVEQCGDMDLINLSNELKLPNFDDDNYNEYVNFRMKHLTDYVFDKRYLKIDDGNRILIYETY